MTRNIDRLSNAVHAATSIAMVSDSEGWRERRKRLDSIGSAQKQIAAVAIHYAVGINPNLVRNILVRPYESRGYEVLGIGFSTTVIRVGGMALKLFRATENMSAQKKEETIYNLKSSQAILLDNMAEYSLEQSFGIQKHPFRDSELVVAKQAVVENYEPVRIHNKGSVSGFSLQRKRELTKFADKALEMAEKTGWVVDMLGADNIGFASHSDSLVLVDTVPSRVSVDVNKSVSVKYIRSMAITANEISYSIGNDNAGVPAPNYSQARQLE